MGECLPATKQPDEYGDSLRIEGHSLVFHGRILPSELTIDFDIEEFQDCMYEGFAVSSRMIREPFVKIEIFSSRSKGGDI